MRHTVKINKRSSLRIIDDMAEDIIALADIVEIGTSCGIGFEMAIRDLKEVDDEEWVNVKKWLIENAEKEIEREVIRRGEAFENGLKKLVNSSPLPKDKKKSKKEGYVYLLSCPRNGLFKIGKAKDVNERMVKIQPKFPAETELVYSFFSFDYDKAERILHNQYKEFRKHGEWFDLSNMQVDEICQIQNGQL